jgi:transposase
MDPFHVVAWATAALDKVRRATWNKLRKRGETERADSMKGSRWALLKNPVNLTRKQRSTLAQLKEDNRDLFTGYLLKEQLRAVFAEKSCVLSHDIRPLESQRQQAVRGVRRGARPCPIPRVSTGSAPRRDTRADSVPNTNDVRRAARRASHVVS